MINEKEVVKINKNNSEKLLEKIEKDIMDLTGLTKEQLDTMDIGDIERYLGIEATNPAKKKSLYKFVSSDTLEYRRKYIDYLLKDCDA